MFNRTCYKFEQRWSFKFPLIQVKDDELVSERTRPFIIYLDFVRKRQPPWTVSSFINSSLKCRLHSRSICLMRLFSTFHLYKIDTLSLFWAELSCVSSDFLCGRQPLCGSNMLNKSNVHLYNLKTMNMF